MIQFRKEWTKTFCLTSGQIFELSWAKTLYFLPLHSSARWIMNYELLHRPHLSRELQTTSEKWFLVPGHDRPGSCHVTHFYPSDSVSKSRMSQSSNRSTITITTDASADCLVSLFFITNYIVYMRWSLAGQRPHQSSSLSDVLTCLLGQSEIEYIISISLFLNDPLNGITWNKYIMWPASSKTSNPNKQLWRHNCHWLTCDRRDNTD